MTTAREFHGYDSIAGIHLGVEESDCKSMGLCRDLQGALLAFPRLFWSVIVARDFTVS